MVMGGDDVTTKNDAYIMNLCFRLTHQQPKWLQAILKN